MENKKVSWLEKVMQSFERWIIRKAIYLKNHISIIPLYVTMISTIIITATIFIFNDAINVMPYNDINGFLFFVTVLSSIMGSVSYLMATGKHVSKKKQILMLCMYYIFMVLQIVLDILYRIDVAREIRLDPTLTRADRWFIPLSSTWALIHIIVICFALVLSVLAPILQPITKKIQVNGRIKKDKTETPKEDKKQTLEDSVEDVK